MVLLPDAVSCSPCCTPDTAPVPCASALRGIQIAGVEFNWRCIFAGATADAFTLFERLEMKLEENSGAFLRQSSSLLVLDVCHFVRYLQPGTARHSFPCPKCNGSLSLAVFFTSMRFLPGDHALCSCRHRPADTCGSGARQELANGQVLAAPGCVNAPPVLCRTGSFQCFTAEHYNTASTLRLLWLRGTPLNWVQLQGLILNPKT